MSKPKNDLSPSSFFVANLNSLVYGRCYYCRRIVDETAQINGFNYCKKCKDKKFPLTYAAFKESDAKFKCPSSTHESTNGCGANQLSYREFCVGSCCEGALNRRVDKECFGEYLMMNDIYEKSKTQEDFSFRLLHLARNNLGNAIEERKKARLALLAAEQKESQARKTIKSETALLQKKKEWNEKVQKRLFITTKALAKETDSDFYEPPKKKAKTDDENEKLQCKICLNPFDDDHPEAVITPCGHRACLKCIESLLQKECPSCRAKFTDKKVFKIY